VTFRELGLGDFVMAGKERWRKHVKTLDLEGFPKAWISRGLREMHHVGDHMDGRMDACLGYTTVLGAEIYKSIGELQDDLREDQKKRSFDGWERMDTKRQLEDSLRCHDFHSFYSFFFLSLKRPNTCSNHDMALSYLILSYLSFSHFKVT